MKKLLFILALGAMTPVVNATIVTITCQNIPSHFLPVNAVAVCGDTIRWTWITGQHIVGPISPSDIPVGATMWVAPIDVNNTSFQYVVTVAGTYDYVCHPATPHGENASFVVTCPSGIQIGNDPGNFSIAYPNPFEEHIIIEFPEADLVQIHGCTGALITSFEIRNGQTKLEVFLGTIPEGLYFYTILREGAILETGKIVRKR